MMDIPLKLSDSPGLIPRPSVPTPTNKTITKHTHSIMGWLWCGAGTVWWTTVSSRWHAHKTINTHFHPPSTTTNQHWPIKLKHNTRLLPAPLVCQTPSFVLIYHWQTTITDLDLRHHRRWVPRGWRRRCEFTLKVTDFFTRNDGFCTKIHGLYSRKDGFSLQMMDFPTKNEWISRAHRGVSLYWSRQKMDAAQGVTMMNFVLTMVNFH